MQLDLTQPPHLLLSSRDPPLPCRDRVPDICRETHRSTGDDPDRGVGWETVEPAREEREQVGPAAFDRPLLGAPTAAARTKKEPTSYVCELGWDKPRARKVDGDKTDQVDLTGFSSSISSFSSPASRLGDDAFKWTIPSRSVSPPVTKRRRSILSLRYRVDSASCASTHSLAPGEEDRHVSLPHQPTPTFSQRSDSLSSRTIHHSMIRVVRTPGSPRTIRPPSSSRTEVHAEMPAPPATRITTSWRE